MGIRKNTIITPQKPTVQKHVPNIIEKAIKDRTMVAIILCINQLPEYLYWQFCEIITNPAMQEKPTPLRVGLFVSDRWLYLLQSQSFIITGGNGNFSLPSLLCSGMRTQH